MKLFLLAALSLSIAGSALAQTPAPVNPKAARSEDINRKMRQLDALVQIVPLTLTKAQVGDLLNAMDRAREKDKQVHQLEDDDLAKEDEKVTKAVDDAINKGTYPSREIQTEIFKLTRAMSIRRHLFIGDQVDIIYAGATKTLNAGQLKVMENSLDPKLLGVKGDFTTAESKIKFYIRSVLLDDAAYDVLIKLSMKKD